MEEDFSSSGCQEASEQGGEKEGQKPTYHGPFEGSPLITLNLPLSPITFQKCQAEDQAFNMWTFGRYFRSKL